MEKYSSMRAALIVLMGLIAFSFFFIEDVGILKMPKMKPDPPIRKRLLPKSSTHKESLSDVPVRNESVQEQDIRNSSSPVVPVRSESLGLIGPPIQGASAPQLSIKTATSPVAPVRNGPPENKLAAQAHLHNITLPVSPDKNGNMPNNRAAPLPTQNVTLPVLSVRNRPVQNKPAVAESTIQNVTISVASVQTDPANNNSVPVQKGSAPALAIKSETAQEMPVQNIPEPVSPNMPNANEESTDFVDFNRGSTTETYHMVCLTHFDVPYQYVRRPENITWYAKTWNYTFFSRRCYHQQKSITVFVDNATDFMSKPHQVGFKLQFKDLLELPKDYKIIHNQTAYFLGNGEPREPYNFYHFVKQIYFPLYHMMKLTNQLHSDAQNIIFYPAPYAMCETDKRVIYHNPNKFKHFRDILRIKNKLELSAFVDKPDPHKVCYKNAVFSSELFLNEARQSTEYFKQTLNIRDDVCMPKTLTIINRGLYRKILNTGYLKRIAGQLGYNTREVIMENLTMKEQAQLIHCTDVLVGVTGAGFQWAFFMKDDSVALEIAWPDKEWPYLFSVTSGPVKSNQLGVVRPLKITQLKAKCIYNLKAANIYTKDIFDITTNFTERETLDLFEDKRNYGYLYNPVLSVGKLCDTVVDEEGFKNSLLALQ